MALIERSTPADDFWTHAIATHCVGCTETLIHPVRVEVDRGGDVVEIDHDGVGFATRDSHARGVVITLEFACEFGHRFDYRLVFHKGSTYVGVIRQPDAPLDPELGPMFPATIWRD